MTNIKQRYKQTEFGVIPEDWEVKTVYDIAPLQRGFDLPINNISDGLYPVVFSNGILKSHKEYKVKGPGVVTGRSGTIGKLFYVAKDFWPHNTTLWVTNFKGNSPVFVYYLFNRLNFGSLATGSGVPTLNRNDIHELKIGIPNSKIEQTAIATSLSDTDTLIAVLDKKIAKKQQIKQGAMQQLLTGKKRLPGFSGEWVEKKICEVGKVITGSTPSRSNPDLWNGNFVWVSAQDLKSKYIVDSVEKITEDGKNTCRVLPPNSVLVTCIASIGLNALSKVACATNQQINSVVCNSDNEPEFLYYQINNNVENLKMIAGQTAVPIINKGQFENFTLMFPNAKSEQTAIAQILTDMDNEITQLEKERDKYKELKAGMMQVLLTGRVRLV